MEFKKLIIPVIASAIALAATAQAMDPASRAMLRRHRLSERLPAATSEQGAVTLRSLMRSKSPIPTGEAPIIPALIKLDDGVPPAALQGDGVEILGDRHGIVFATLTPEAACRLDINPSVRAIELNRRRDLKMNIARQVTGLERVHQGIDLPRAYTGKNVVCGIVDAGFDPNHPNFLKADGTSRFGYFAQVSANSSGAVVIDERDPAKLSTFTTDDASTFHGTHTTGIMAGSYRGPITIANEAAYPATEIGESQCPYYGIAYDGEIAASTGTSYDAFIANALNGILEWRWYNRHGRPIVVNMSLGGPQGPHDGSSLICQFLDLCAENDNAVICLSAGNEGDIPLTISKTLDDDNLTFGTGIKPFVYGPDKGNIRYGIAEIYSADDTPFEMQAVIYNKARGSVICRMPMSNTVGSSIQYWVSGPEYQESGDDIVDTNFARAFSGYVGVVPTIDINTGRFYAVVDIYTKDNPQTNADGKYVLGIEIVGKPGQRINGFTDGQYVSFESFGINGWVDGSTDGTISDMACGKNTISVGSYDSRDHYPTLGAEWRELAGFTPGTVTYYSSYATMPDGRSLPHLCAPGAAIISSTSSPYINGDNGFAESDLQGKITGSSRDSYYQQMDGTSMAAPVVSGTVALMLEANPRLTYKQVRDILMETAVKDEAYDALADPAQGGAGKIDSHAAVKRAVAMSGVDNIWADNAKRPMATLIADRVLRVAMPGADSVTATLHDIAGRKIASATDTSDEVDMNIGPVSSGVYILKVNSAAAMRILVK